MGNTILFTELIHISDGEKRAIVLLDGMFLQNILNAFGLFGKVDYKKFSDKLIGKYHVRFRTYVFDALPPGNPLNQKKKQGFLDRLGYLDKFQIEKGYVKMEKKTCPNCSKIVYFPRQKKVDILLATRLLECSFDPKIDKIVIVAGDADFVPAIEIGKKQKEIVLAYADTEDIGAATELKTICDIRIVLSKEYFKDCTLVK